MKYAKLDENNKVIQVQPYPEDGYIEVDDNVVCGMVKDGNVFIIHSPIKTPEQIKSEIEQAIQSMLDNKAIELRYDNIMSARSYAGFANPFQVEAQTLAVWCANCWLKAGELEATGNVYTVEEVLAQMPIYGA